jgi:signal transduction histidine kinase
LDIDLELDARAGGLRLGDPVRIRQILSNLISNAVKFTENGGITVKVSARRQATMMIEVVDTGIGFDEDFRQRLFGRFNQADAVPGRFKSERPASLRDARFGPYR